MKNLIIIFIVLLISVACNTSKNTASNNDTPRPNRQGRQQGPPSVDEIFKMDTNGDGKLSKSEIKGPLLNDFAKVDTNNDGFISKSELENAPKPQRRPRQ